MTEHLNLTYRYRLSTRKRDHERLEHLPEAQRLLYNAALEEHIGAWRCEGKSITVYDQMKSLTECRRDLPDMAAHPCAMQRGTLRRLDRAFQGFFTRVKSGHKTGFPRFRGYRRYRIL